MAVTDTAEPDLLRFAITPRAVRRRKRALVKIIVLRLLLLPLILVGIGSIVTIAGVLAWTLGGAEHLATVNQMPTQGPPRRVDYSYAVNGVVRHGSEMLDPNALRRLGPLPQSVKVRSIGLGGWAHDVILMPGDSPWEIALPTLFVAILGVLLGMGCYFFAFTLPRRSRLLYENGTAAAGEITAKVQRVQGKTLALTLSYAFYPSTGAERIGALNVWRPLFVTAREGEAIVILYDPGNPDHNVVYEYGDYELAS